MSAVIPVPMNYKPNAKYPLTALEASSTDDFYNSVPWLDVRRQVLTAYGRRCMCCGATPDNPKGTMIVVDHIKPMRTHKELALDFNNMQVLCSDCNRGKGHWDTTDYRTPYLTPSLFDCKKPDEASASLREEIIDPVRAKELLALNTCNRKLKKNYVKQLAEKMTSGEWLFNGDTIRIKGDRLIDGQHRLHAIVKSGLSQRMLLVDSIDDNAFQTIDVGKRRSPGDTLEALGEKNSRLLASAVRTCIIYDSYAANKDVLHADIFRHSDVRNKIKHSDIIEFLDKNPSFRESLDNNGSTMLKSYKTSLHYIFSRIDSDLADEFINRMNGNYEGKDKKDHFIYFREKLITMNSSNSKKNEKFIVMALAIVAWNCKRSGDKPSSIRFDPRTDKFPIAI